MDREDEYEEFEVENTKMCELVCELENILSEMQAYERRLSELFDGKITVEGLDTFLQKIRSAAAQDVRKCLSPALKGLPIMATGSMKSTSTSSSGQNEPEFLALTMPDFTMGAEVLVPGMMTCFLKHLREKPGEMVQQSLAKLTIQLSNLGLVSVVGKKAVAATYEICNLVMRVVSIFLSHCGNYSRHFLYSVTGIIARDKMAAVLRCFTETAKTFNLLGFNSTYFQLKPVVQAVVTYLGKIYQSRMAAAFKYQLPLVDDHSSELEEFRGKIEAPIIVEEVPSELLGKVVDSEQNRFLSERSYCHRRILAKQPKEELAAARYIIYYHDPDELLEKTEKKSVEKGSLDAVSESLSLALLPPEAIQLVATGHITDVRAEKALVKAEAKELVMDGLRTASCKVVEDLITAANEMVGMDTPLDTEISQTEKVVLITGKAKCQVTTEDVPDELLEKTEKKSVEKGTLAAVSESLSLALLPPEAIQLVATGHIADVRAKKAFMKAGAKELVMVGLKTAASKVVEDLIAASVEMLHMTTPLDTQISQTRKMALINGKSEIAAENVLNELLEKVVKESEKRRSLALISVSDCPPLATQLPQLTDLVPEQCSGEAAKCADEDRQVKKKKETKKKKKGIRAFFRGLWKRMICSSGIPKDD
ncbi:uncharacterized protein LOC124487483 isoform X2 [Hypomesus transpacificus]|nr:uncharacterized protein LOC124487483 isoform X2 [Hypomesus transpacificus]